MQFREKLKGIIPNWERLPRAFDIVGDVAILEIPEGFEKYEKEIAKAVMEQHKHLKTVCKKIGERSGICRLRPLKVILGDGTETIHKEYGCLFKLDVQKVYFSVREDTERQRIADQIKDGEFVLVMFSGIAPYAIVAAKKKDAKFVCIEINRDAVRYAEENVAINKVKGRVKNILGDVRICKGKFDRIIMPLPESAINFLDIALKCSKKGAIIHLYCISKDKSFSDVAKKVRRIADDLGFKIRILRKRKVLPYAPRTWKGCIEFKVLELSSKL